MSILIPNLNNSKSLLLLLEETITCKNGRIHYHNSTNHSFCIGHSSNPVWGYHKRICYIFM